MEEKETARTGDVVQRDDVFEKETAMQSDNTVHWKAGT